MTLPAGHMPLQGYDLCQLLVGSTMQTAAGADYCVAPANDYLLHTSYMESLNATIIQVIHSDVFNQVVYCRNEFI